MNSPLHIKDQETLVFDNRFVNELPGDPIKESLLFTSPAGNCVFPKAPGI